MTTYPQLVSKSFPPTWRLAIPKSATLICLLSSSSRFSGFRSLWLGVGEGGGGVGGGGGGKRVIRIIGIGVLSWNSLVFTHLQCVNDKRTILLLSLASLHTTPFRGCALTRLGVCDRNQRQTLSAERTFWPACTGRRRCTHTATSTQTSLSDSLPFLTR